MKVKITQNENDHKNGQIFELFGIKGSRVDELQKAVGEIFEQLIQNKISFEESVQQVMNLAEEDNQQEVAAMAYMSCNMNHCHKQTMIERSLKSILPNILESQSDECDCEECRAQRRERPALKRVRGEA